MALGPGRSRKEEAEAGVWVGAWGQGGREASPVGAVGAADFPLSQGGPGEGVELRTGEVAAGVHRSLQAAAGAGDGGLGRQSRRG